MCSLSKVEAIYYNVKRGQMTLVSLPSVQHGNIHVRLTFNSIKVCSLLNYYPTEKKKLKIHIMWNLIHRQNYKQWKKVFVKI